MTPLRQRMIEEMRIRDFSKHTIAAYVSVVYRLANYYHRSPDKLDREDIRASFSWIWSSRSRCLGRITNRCCRRCDFYYRHVLRQGEVVEDVRGPRPQKRLPVVLSVQEVARFFKAIPSLKHRTILMLAYGAGLRIGEAVRMRLCDIDRQRKVIRVQQGKGKKDRYTVLSPALLEILDRYCWAARPEDLPFTTRFKDRPITDSRVQSVCVQARKDAGIDKADFAAHVASQFRDPSAGSGDRFARDSSAAGRHASSKTTAIYTYVSTALIGKTVSPLDTLPDV